MYIFLNLILAIFAVLSTILLPLLLLVALFKKKWRKKSLKMAGLAFVVGVICVALLPNPDDQAAKEAGFQSAAEMQEAATFGIEAAGIWEEQKSSLRTQRSEEEARQKAAEEAQKQAEKEAAEEAEREAQRKEAEAKAQAEAEEKRKGFHCLSAWDGSHAAFKRYVKSQMRNPDSFDHISTRVTPVDENGQHTLLMEYRAENGFGGMNVGTAMAKYSNATCDFTLISLE